MLMLKWLKLSEHIHSGKLRPHEHTSYIPLFFLLIVVGVALSAYTAFAADHPPPQSSSVSVTGTMPSKPPVVAATIDKPANGQHFTTSPINVSGSCPPNTLIEIFKNNIFAGSTPCTDASTYSLDVDLLIGNNILLAKVYDALNQTGPDSVLINVSYDALPSQAGSLTPLNLGGPQLLLNTDAVFRGTFPQQDLTMPISIIGGTPPFAVNIQWGDTANKVISRKDNSSFNTTHVFSKPGNYQIALQTTDSLGRVAFLTVAAIVNGQPNPTAITATTSGNNLLILWPLYVGAICVVISFWLGEKREKRIFRIHGLPLNP